LHRYELRPQRDPRIPADTWKITYTSGTTGAPKGVCLSAEQLQDVAAGLLHATGLQAPRHLCVMPLSTLLENVAGVYAPLLAGGAIIVPSLAEVGLSGSSGLDIERLLAAVTLYRPDSLILVPEILRAMVFAAERGWRPPSSLRFVAVGGSKIAPALVERSRQAGLPVFEGYGLSECGSVIALNTPGHMRVGTAGRPLRHVRVSVDQGEIVVAGSPMLGYADQPETWGPGEIRTGDRGRVDSEGFVHIDGRLSNLIITGFGRNISPEWVECELLSGPVLMQAIVIGDARPWCSALVCATEARIADRDIDAWIRKVNQHLPDYARIVNWRRLPEPLTTRNGLLTNNGRPRRAPIEEIYRPLIDGLYETTPEAINQ
jgi:long-subunit acyl-CoA synthetase (AMP-forming)